MANKNQHREPRRKRTVGKRLVRHRSARARRAPAGRTSACSRPAAVFNPVLAFPPAPPPQADPQALEPQEVLFGGQAARPAAARPRRRGPADLLFQLPHRGDHPAALWLSHFRDDPRAGAPAGRRRPDARRALGVFERAPRRRGGAARRGPLPARRGGPVGRDGLRGAREQAPPRHLHRPAPPPPATSPAIAAWATSTPRCRRTTRPCWPSSAATTAGRNRSSAPTRWRCSCRRCRRGRLRPAVSRSRQKRLDKIPRVSLVRGHGPA